MNIQTRTNSITIGANAMAPTAKRLKNNMNDISDLLRELLDRYSNTLELDQEFERMRREEEGFEEEYANWCEENGYSLKDGYRDFINEIVESQDSYWDSYHEFGNNI